MVERLTTDANITRIAVMFQDDSFGRAGYNGVLAALDKRGMALVATGVYPRNTTAVKSALLDLRQGNPEAVILVGAYKPVAALNILGPPHRLRPRIHDGLLSWAATRWPPNWARAERVFTSPRWFPSPRTTPSRS